MAADSRVTLTAAAPGQMPINVNFDNATKLLTFGDRDNPRRVAAVTYGDAVMGTKPTDLRTAHSFLPEFETQLPQDKENVRDFAQRLSDFYLARWRERMPPDYKGPGMTFCIGGYDPDAAYGSVYVLTIPGQPTPAEQSPNDFGITIGGQSEAAIRLLQGYDVKLPQIVQRILNLQDSQVATLVQNLRLLSLAIPFAVLPLQDSIDLAIFLIRATVTAQKLSIGIRGVGGAIDVAVITRREGLRIIQRKDLSGEN